jgi:anti-anti-sigma factor
MFLHIHNTRVKVIDITSELTGNLAINLQRTFYKYLDESECHLLISLKHVKKIDGLGISLLEQLSNRGGDIHLFNVGANVRNMLRMSGKESCFKIYNETEPHKVASMFEKEKPEDNSNNDGIRKRRYPRVETCFQAGFKYQPGHNGVISGYATILNLSEEGFLADKITAVNTKNGETINHPIICGHELSDIKFMLNEYSKPIETKGKCLREIKADGRHCVSIRFKDMKQDYREMVRNYVFSTCNN